jgi:hypothetical protein
MWGDAAGDAAGRREKGLSCVDWQSKGGAIGPERARSSRWQRHGFRRMTSSLRRLLLGRCVRCSLRGAAAVKRPVPAERRKPLFCAGP